MTPDVSSVVRAISIRQPYVELILRGAKKREFRSRPTRIRERVYVYAALSPAQDAASWRKVNRQPGSLKIGAIVGTVDIVDCKDHADGYAYVLEKPKRLRRHLYPVNQPLPGFWKPKF